MKVTSQSPAFPSATAIRTVSASPSRAPEGSKKLVIVGDTETSDGLAGRARDADALVIEATFLDRDAAIARDYGHLTTAEAAALAAMSGVKRLPLTHISGRYPAEDILAEATKIFPMTRLAADLDHIVV